MLENTLEGTAGPLLAYMLKKSRISDDELAELRTLLEQHAGDERNGERNGERARNDKGAR